MTHLSSLEPNDELLKYKQKRAYASNESSKGVNIGRTQKIALEERKPEKKALTKKEKKERKQRKQERR